MIIKYAYVEVMEVPDDTPENMIDAMVREKVGDTDYVFTTDGSSPIDFEEDYNQ